MKDNKFSILYVDDELSNLRIFKNTFRKKYNVITVDSAKKGISVLQNEVIDIILCDQRMPEMTGVEFFEYTLKEYPDLNRILITGYTDFNAIKNAINDAKIYQYVQKPWREDDLNTTIKEALKIYELENKNKKLVKDLKIALGKLKIEIKKAEESDRLKSVFLSNISHEIRTPMNGIIGFSTLLKKEDLSDKTRIKYAEIVIRSTNRLLKIIEDIVEISKLSTNQIKVHNSKVNIISLFEDLTAICKTQIDNKNIEVNLKNNIPEKEGIIKTDEAKLNKIVGNLINNAIRFTEEGVIEITCKIENNKLIAQIKDTGIGIAPEMQEKIFERFIQVEENNKKAYDGLGLGLAIVKENIKILGGSINVESEKGKGSIFTFEITVNTN